MATLRRLFDEVVMRGRIQATVDGMKINQLIAEYERVVLAHNALVDRVVELEGQLASDPDAKKRRTRT